MITGKEFVEYLIKGDENAWRQFMKEQGRVILAAAVRCNLNSMEQEEVFQETCLVVYRRLKSLQDPEKLTSWVYVIAYRQALRLVHRRSKETQMASDVSLQLEMSEGDIITALDLVVQHDMVNKLQKAMNQLESRCRKLLRFLYLDTSVVSYEKISRNMGIPIGSIGPTRSRCLKKLKILMIDVSSEAAESSTE